MQNLIALSGCKGSGKSTLANHLKENGYTELTFAEPLKQLIITLFGIDPSWVYDPNKKETIIPDLGVSGRELCQVIGTELFRKGLNDYLPNLKLRGGNIWIHSMLSQLDKTNGNIVISDCRFPDEYQALHSAGFKCLEVIRPTNVVDTHSSEQGCPNDGEISNNGTVEDLYNEGCFKIENKNPNTV